MDGVYIDQIGAMASAPKYCYDRSHNHPVGGGHYWYQGYSKML